MTLQTFIFSVTPAVDLPTDAVPEHIIDKQVSPASRFKCFLCCYRNYDKEKLLPHMLLHSVNNQTKKSNAALHCTLCPYITNNIDTLRSHFLCHTTLTSFRIYTCDHCQLVTDDIDFMDRHLNVTHANRDYRFLATKLQIVPDECPWCSEKIIDANYTEHIIQHHQAHQAMAYAEGAIPYVDSQTQVTT